MSGSHRVALGHADIPRQRATRWRVEEVQPAAIRDELVDFFWEQRHWPYATREEYTRAWNWRQTSLGDAPARVWIARAEGSREILGHLAVYPRRFRLRGRELLAGVPGNFLVRPEYRNSLIGPRLAAVLRRLVLDGEFDVMLAYGNPAAHQMFARLGFRTLGRLHEYIDVRRSGAILRRYSRAAVAAAPVVDAALAMRRWWRRRVGRRGIGQWSARELSASEVRALDRSHWVEHSERIVATAAGEHLASRYLSAPFATYRIAGIFDRNGAVHALVVITARHRVKVCECVTNARTLDVPTAIEVATGALGSVGALLVATLSASETAGELSRYGFMGREPRDPVAERSWWSAYWRADHGLATHLGNPACWTLFFGSTHY